MACDILGGRLKPCNDSVGGTKKAYLYNFLEDAFTVVAGEATAINPLLTAVYDFYINGDTNPFEQSKVGERTNGTSINTQTITLVLKQMDAPTSEQMNKLTAGNVSVVVEDRNGNFVVAGFDDGIDWTVVATTGSAKTDLNGYTLTGTATTKNFAPFLNEATITQFLALVV